MKGHIAKLLTGSASSLAAVAMLVTSTRAAAQASPVWTMSQSRLHLPVPAPTYGGALASSVAASAPQAFPPLVRAPSGAPNVIVIVSDDVGFGTSGTFGGLVPTPTLDALAAEGARYNRFHDAALCSPTRASLLTGRNSHRVGFGNIAEMSTGYPGYTATIPNTAATIGKVLTLNGYSSAWIGKDHNTPTWETTPDGPFDRWPTRGLGFEYFYGFMGGATNQFAPDLYEDTRPVVNIPQKGYVLDRDLADHAIGWLQTHHTIHPDKPFFLFYAPGSTHSPNQAPKEWIDRFKGRFDAGWDSIREQIFARQKKLGIIPADAQLSPRPDAIPAWASLKPDERKVAARLMEAAAGQLAFADDQIGRLIGELKSEGVYDDTMIVYMQGDNGQSSEGGVLGTTSDIGLINGHRPDTAFAIAHLDEIGTSPNLQSNIPSGFAWAMDTPFQWFKAIASHLGGMRNDLVISWPGRIRSPEIVRSQFHHVVDIAPTILEVAGLPAPETVDGVPQMSTDGVSMAYTFNQPRAADRRSEQIFEVLGNRALYKDGWMISTKPKRTTDINGPSSEADSYTWELYDLRRDYSQAIDLAASNPAKLAEMRAAFDRSARINNVYPVQPVAAGGFLNPLRPSALGQRNSFTYGPSSEHYPDSAFPDIKNRSWRAEVTFETSGAKPSGTLIAQGGRLGGWGVRLDQGRPEMIYTVGPATSDRTVIKAEAPFSMGQHQLSVEFTYDGAGLGKGGEVRLLAGREVIAAGRVPATVPFIFQEGASIGRDYGTSLAPDYEIPDVFEGSIKNVKLQIGPVGSANKAGPASTSGK